MIDIEVLMVLLEEMLSLVTAFALVFSGVLTLVEFVAIFEI